MKEKRLAVIIGRCLTVCVLALHLNVMTASAEPADGVEYENVLEETMEAEITLKISGYIQMPAAVTPETPPADSPGEEDPDPGAGGDKATVTPVSDIRTAAPQTGDAMHTQWHILQFMLAGMIICLFIRQEIKERGTRGYLRTPSRTRFQ